MTDPNGLTPEAKAEIDAAVKIVQSDRTHKLNRDSLRKMLQEELAAWKPPASEPPKPADPPPTPPPTPPGPTPPPPAPPTPPEPPLPPKKRSRLSYWPEQDD